MQNSFFLIVLLAFSLSAHGKISINEALNLQALKKKINNESTLIIAQKKLEGFFSCAKLIENSKPLVPSKAASCIQQFIHPEAGKGMFQKYLIWLQQDIQVSQLGYCGPEQYKIIEIVRKNSSDTYYCFVVKEEQGQSVAVIGFRDKNHDPLIYHIKY